MFQLRLGYPYVILVFILLSACAKVEVEKGVSLVLAQARKKSISDLQYYLHFDIPEVQTQKITGKNRIQFNFRPNEAAFLYLDFNEREDHLIQVTVNKKRASLIFENEHLSIPTKLLNDGKNEIEIEFVAGDLSLNRNSDYLYTLFVPDRASTCFPVFDQPDLKSIFNLELLVPIAWEAIANSKASNLTEVEGKTLHQFEPTKPISTYQFAFAVGKFNKTSDPETGMTMYYRETDSTKVALNKKAIFELHRQSRAWLEQYTSIPYPFQKLDYVLIPTFQYGGMEHPGNIFYRESSLILEETSSVNQKLRRASLIAHETAHMWFGNLVTMEWFNDVWLKEVFANFMAAKIVNPQFPEIDHDLRFLMAHYPSAYAIDRSEGSHPIQQELNNLKNAGTLYGAIIYQKAPIMMRNLESLMGEDNFQLGLQDYLAQYSFSNASWDDLVNSLKKFTDKDLEVWNKAWIKTRGIPNVSYTIGNKINVNVTNDSAKIIWPQAFKFQFTDNSHTVVEDIVIESPEGATLPIEVTQARVIPNYEGRGYGYFDADDASIQFMLASVNSIENVQARASIWINLWEYLVNNKISTQQLTALLLKSIRQEKNPLLLEYITNLFETVFWQFTRAEDRLLIGAEIDQTLIELMALEKDNSLKRIYFNCFKKVATSHEGIADMKKFWANEMTLGLDISEQDHIQLACELAIRDVSDRIEILETQLRNTKNPDRKEAMKFIIPALSSDESKRDAFFESLKDPVNREHEPWVLTALSYLHHPLLEKESVKYIKPSLEMLEEIQLTGDIFFPKGWVDQTVSSYQTKEAVDAVNQFLIDHPQLPPNLKNKLLQSADLMFRAEKILSVKNSKAM